MLTSSEAFDRARETISTINRINCVDIQAIVLALHWLCEKLPDPSSLPDCRGTSDTLCEVF